MPKKADARLRALAELALQPMPSHAPTALNPAPQIPLGRGERIGPMQHTLAEFAAMPAEQRKRVALRESLNTFNAEDVGALGEGLMTMGQIRAFHGSPHHFEKFDIRHMGTGEGAQAYGPGHYFAEAEGTARGYRNRLSEAKDATVEGGGRLPGWAARSVEAGRAGSTAHSDSIDAIIADFKGRRAEAQANIDAKGTQYWMDETRVKDIDEILLGLENAKKGAAIHKPGAMYEVNIDAEPDELLHWDKPLSEQSPQVRQVFVEDALEHAQPVRRHDGTYSVTVVKPDGTGDVVNAISADTGQEALAQYEEFVLSSRGEDAWRMAAKRAAAGRPKKVEWGDDPIDPEAAAAALRRRGIKGIRYLDQMSRGSGEGTHNLVVFDDDLIDIKRKYAALAALGAGGAAANRER